MTPQGRKSPFSQSPLRTVKDVRVPRVSVRIVAVCWLKPRPHHTRPVRPPYVTTTACMYFPCAHRPFIRQNRPMFCTGTYHNRPARPTRTCHPGESNHLYGGYLYRTRTAFKRNKIQTHETRDRRIMQRFKSEHRPSLIQISNSKDRNIL